MFLLGQWRNYDDLEECMTLDELTTTYSAILEKENKRMEFEAKIAGAELKNESNSSGGLKEYMRQKEQEMREAKAVAGQTADFGAGIGHTVIGG